MENAAVFVSLIFLIVLLVLAALILAAIGKLRREQTAGELKILIADNEKNHAESLRIEAKGIRQEVQEALSLTRKELTEGMERLRGSSTEVQGQFQKAVQERLDRYSETLSSRLESLQKSAGESSEKQIQAMAEVRTKITDSVTLGLKEIQDKNEQKLEQMRQTVDEKLQETLNTRLTQSFEVVTKQLVEVQKGLTEMQSLAQDVGGLKKALTNVKVRGMLGEAQLGALLEQFLSREQYAENVAVKPRSSERVEFAIKLPGGDDGQPVWLSIDSKFPIEDYQRLQEAYELGDKPAWELAGKAFENRIYQHAVDISSKYIAAPHTTDFALMFLPFESLYAEAIRRPGLFQDLSAKYHVVVVGPTTLTAFLNSLQVGFKTLAISKQSSEVWKVLGAVKTEFQKFGEAVSKVQKNLDIASSNLSTVSDRAKQMERKLSKVSALPAEESLRILPPEKGDSAEAAAEESDSDA
ncbi:MAG: DNA recombination protein RmuC [Spirochaetes bacterium]|nr:DNA recombination protein RmuC [Spirochaetota bacterium]